MTIRQDEDRILAVLRERLGDWATVDALRANPDIYQRMSASPGRLGQLLARLERRGQIERDIRGGRRIVRAIMTPDSERAQLPEEHYHYATDGPPGRRTAPPCHCYTPGRPIRPVSRPLDFHTAGVIPNGSTVQYRKVGRGVVRFHECKLSGRDCDGTASLHLYLVHFLTGTYRGESKRVWVRNSELLKPADPFAGIPNAGGEQDYRPAAEVAARSSRPDAEKQLALVRELAGNYSRGLLSAGTAMDAIVAAVLDETGS